MYSILYSTLFVEKSITEKTQKQKQQLHLVALLNEFTAIVSAVI